MTRRLTFLLTRSILAAFLLFCAMAPAGAADGIEVVQAHLETSDDGYRLSATFGFDLNQSVGFGRDSRQIGVNHLTA